MADGSVTIKVDLDGSSAQSGVSKLKTLLGGLGSTGSKVGSVFKSVLGANLISSALTTGIGVVTGGIRSMASELNSSQKAWKTFEGNLQAFGRSPEVIKAAKTEMQDFATKTIYSASDMASTYSQLDAVGTKNVGSLVKAFGGLAASAENPAQAMKSLSTQATQMASKPKVAWMDFKIMMEQAPAGMAAVAKEMGMSTAELVSAVQDGKVSTEDFFDAMNRAGNSDAFQKMATEFKTVDQAIDGAKESLANKLMPAFEQLNKFGIKVVNALSDALEKINFDKMAKKLGKFLDGINVEGIVSKIGGAISSLVGKVQTFWQSFTNTGALPAVIGAIKSIAGALGHVWNALTASSVLNVLASVLGNVVKWLSQATTLAANFIRSLPAGAIQAIVGGLVGLVAGFKAFNFLKSFNPFRLFKKNATSGVSGATSVVKSASKSVVSIIRSLGQSVATAARGIGQGVGAAFRGIGQGLAMVNPATIAALAVPILALGAAFALMGMQGQGIATILQAVGSVVVSVGTAIGTILNMALQGLANALVTVAPVLPTIASAFAQLSPLITAAGTAIATVISAFSNLAPVITALGSALSQVITAISSGIAQIATAVTPIVEIISSAFVQVVTVVSQAIVQIIQALAPFIPAISEMVQAIAPVLQSLVEAFNNLISQISPIIDSLTQLLQTFGEQVSSILDSASGVVESFGSSIRNVLDGVAGIFESMGSAAKNAGQGVKLMAQGIKMLTDLPLGDLTGTLAAVAGGLTGIANSGIASAGPGLQQAGIGLGLIATSAQIASVAMQALPGAFSSLSSSIGTLPGVMTTAGSAMRTFASAVMSSFVGLTGSTASISALQSRITALSASMMMVAQAGASAMSASFSNISRAATSAMNQLSSAVRSAMAQAVSTMRSSMQQMVSVVRQSASQMTQAGRQAGKGVSDGVTNGIRGGIGSARAAMSAMVNAIRSTGMSGAGAMRSVGAMIGQGLAQGMYSALGAVTAAANALVAQAERAAQAKAKIHSPSRLFRDNVGRYIAQGIAVGIEKNTPDVTDSLAYVQKEMSAFKFGAEDLLGLGNGSLSSQFKLKSITERAEMSQIEVIRDHADKALIKALEVAEQAVKRPVNMVLDDGTLVAKIGQPMTNYQNDKIKIDNMMRGIV